MSPLGQSRTWKVLSDLFIWIFLLFQMKCFLPDGLRFPHIWIFVFPCLVSVAQSLDLTRNVICIKAGESSECQQWSRNEPGLQCPPSPLLWMTLLLENWEVD